MRRLRSAAAAMCAAISVSADATAHDRAFPSPVVRYPSADAADPATLAAAAADPRVTSIVFERGEHVLPGPLVVAGRDGLTLEGATDDPAAVTLRAPGSVVEMRRVRNVALRGLRLVAEGEGSVAVRIDTLGGDGAQRFGRGIDVDRCVIEAAVGVHGEAGARTVVLDRCTIRTLRPGGVGVLWDDGEGLFVTRSRFIAPRGAAAGAAVRVRGASGEGAAGARAAVVMLTRNVVEGDFARGFEFADVVRTGVMRNRIRLDGALTTGAVGDLPAGSGRVGISLRTAASTLPSSEFTLHRNAVRGAHTGVWLDAVATGSVEANDFRSCGAPFADARFGDNGSALRISAPAEDCTNSLAVERNDLRGLRSPAGRPAVLVEPANRAASCFATNAGNRLDRAHPFVTGPGGP